MLLLEPGGRIVVTNATAQRLVGREDVAWIFWDRVLASAHDAHRVRDSIRAAFRAPCVPQTCQAQMHGSQMLSFRCTALSADAALLSAHADAEPPEDLSGDSMFDRTSLDELEGDGNLLELVAIDQRMSLLRSVVSVDGDSLAGPFHAAPGAPDFFLTLRETSLQGLPALAVTVSP